MKPQVGVDIGLQGLGHHYRTKVGPADADIHDVPDLATGEAFPASVPDRFAEFPHVVEDGIDLRHDVLTINQNRVVRSIAQRDVEDGTILGDVYFFAPEHPVPPAFDVAAPGQGGQQLHGLARDPVLRVVNENVLKLCRKIFETFGIFFKEPSHVNPGTGLPVLVQRGPFWSLSKNGHKFSSCFDSNRVGPTCEEQCGGTPHKY